MGLDMHLTAEKFISGYDFSKDGNFVKILNVLNLQESDVEKHLTINVAVGYWRKANAIHNWFVKNVQSGNDDCASYFVSRENLINLKNDCETALKILDSGDKNGASKVITPTSGFFFGSTEVDSWYRRDLENTIAIVNKCFSTKFDSFDFNYRSSW